MLLPLTLEERRCILSPVSDSEQVSFFFLCFLLIDCFAGDVETIVGRVIKNRNSANRWRSCRVLVIDEISMVSADFFELLDKVGQGVVRLVFLCFC